tara:strand:- start:20235 stop:20810 length:576 start_codon:yes stop_codon:yes gene_type:complete
MNINQLLIITFVILLYILFQDNYYENFQGEITKDTCIQRMLENECSEPEKKASLNKDCDEFKIMIPSGKVNISCDNKLLFNTLLCSRMISEGACESSYGRKQINGICNIEPLNISCPRELKSKDIAIINRIKELQTENEKYKKGYMDRKIDETKLQLKKALTKDDSNKNYILYIIIIIILGIITFILTKKK